MKESSDELLNKVQEVNQFEIVYDEKSEQTDNNLIPNDLLDQEVKEAVKSDFSEKVLSKEFLEDLKKLSGDSRKASAYFQPVINAASEIEACSDDAALAAKMSDLLKKTMSYLSNRGSSMFSKQRNERRNTCMRIVNHIGKFLYDAPPAYSVEIYKSVNEKTARSKYEKDFIKDYGYYLEEDHVFALEGEINLREEKKNEGDGTKNSPRDVLLRRLDGLRSLMTNKMPPYPGDDAPKAKIDAFKEEIQATGLMFSSLYENAIIACDQCKDELQGNQGVWAEDIKKRLIREQRTFSNNISGFLIGHRPDDTTTWKQALAARCGETINLKGRSVKQVGAGTSVVYRIGSKNGMRRFFKEEESIARGPVEAWKATAASIKDIEGYDEFYEPKIQEFSEALMKDMSGYINAEDEETKKEEVDKLYKDLVNQIKYGMEGNKISILRENPEGRKLSEKYNCLKVLRRMGPGEDMAEFFLLILDDFQKRFNLSRIGTERAMIDGGKNVSTRNVATSRMATLLGMDEWVAKSETAEAKMGNKKMYGNVMYEAMGVQAAERYTAKKKMKYSDEAISQICTMTVFDIICGQVDRNSRNYFLMEKDGKLNGLCMIDNDCAFGKLHKDVVKNGTLRLKPLTKELIFTLPEQTKQKIRDLGKLDADHLKLFFGDIIDEEEIKCLKERIDTVIENIDDAEKELERMKQSKDDDDRFAAEMMSDPKFANMYYQNWVYKMLAEKSKEFKKGTPEYNEKWKNSLITTTDLYPSAMEDEFDLEEKLLMLQVEWKKRQKKA